MLRFAVSSEFLLPAAFAVLICSCADSAIAQPTPFPASQSGFGQPTDIAQWIDDLGSSDFLKRRAAVDALQKAGDDAIAPLEAALKEAKLDQKLLLESVLRELKKNSFGEQLKRIRLAPKAADLAKLPEYDRFADLVGKEDQHTSRYLDLVEAEPQLFAAAMKASNSLPDLLERRAASLVRATRPAPVKVERFTIESYGALLLLAGNERHRLPRATSTNISQMLTCAEVREALKQPESEWLLRIAGSYIQRPRIAPSTPLMFAREYRLPEGLQLARTVLKTSLRGRNGIYAMMVIHDQGNDQDLALLESLFENKGVLFKGPTDDADRPYVVCNGDLALAVALILRKQDPREFGFSTVDAPDQKFRLAMDTVGFRDEEARTGAVSKYRERFAVASSD